MAPTTVEITPEQARTHYTHCPRCGCPDSYADNMEQEGPQAWQRFSCDNTDCSGRWTEVFQLVRIEDFTDDAGHCEGPGCRGNDCNCACGPCRSDA